MNELMSFGAEFPTIKGEALAKIERGMIEQRRIGQIFGRSDTQTTRKLMSLTMLASGPYRYLRQCAAEIESRKNALNENAIRLKRSQIEAMMYRDEAGTLDGLARELRLLDAQEKEQSIESSRVYVEGALKDIAALQDAYEQIRIAHNIRENWDEADAEAGEIEHHVKALFKLAFRDVMSTGRIGHAACEYAEQFGVHPMLVQQRVADYVGELGGVFADGKAPTVDSLHEWLEACYQLHKDDYKSAVKHLGLTELITKYSLYVEPENA